MGMRVDNGRNRWPQSLMFPPIVFDNRLLSTGEIFSHKGRKMRSVRVPQTLTCPIAESTETMVSITFGERCP
jgi:hypothetical protein